MKVISASTITKGIKNGAVAVTQRSKGRPETRLRT
jgi:hypothetical protein